MTRLITLLIIRSLAIIKVSSITQILTVILRMLITCYGNLQTKTHSDRINNRFLFQDNTEQNTRDDADARSYESTHENNNERVTNRFNIDANSCLLSAVNLKTKCNLLITRLITLLII